VRVSVFETRTHRTTVETKLQLLVGQKRQLDLHIVVCQKSQRGGGRESATGVRYVSGDK
jgi:hypothetical protein